MKNSTFRKVVSQEWCKELGCIVYSCTRLLEHPVCYLAYELVIFSGNIDQNRNRH